MFVWIMYALVFLFYINNYNVNKLNFMRITIEYIYADEYTCKTVAISSRDFICLMNAQFRPA